MDKTAVREQVEGIKAEIAELKRRKDILDAAPAKEAAKRQRGETDSKKAGVKRAGGHRRPAKPTSRVVAAAKAKSGAAKPASCKTRPAAGEKTSGSGRRKRAVAPAGPKADGPRSGTARARTKKPAGTTASGRSKSAGTGSRKAAGGKPPPAAKTGPKKPKTAAKKKPAAKSKKTTADARRDAGTAARTEHDPSRPATDIVPDLTLEEKLESELTGDEIERFQIEKVNMEQLIRKVCDILAEREHDGMLQNELWKKLKLSEMTGSRLALKLERMGTITREKLLENDRWTYKLVLKKTPISTRSIEDAPCLVCPVEQRCTLDGEISPRTCQYIEEWVIASIKKHRSK